MVASRCPVWGVTASEAARLALCVCALAACHGPATDAPAPGDVDEVGGAESGDATADDTGQPDVAGPDGDSPDAEPLDTDLDVAQDAMTEDVAVDLGGSDTTDDVVTEDVTWLDADADDVDVDCDTTASVALERTDVSWWARSGDRADRMVIDAPVTGTPCGELRALSSVSWLSATWRDDALELTLADDAPAGRLDGQVALVHAGEPALLGMVDVVARVLPGAGGEPRVLFVGIDGMRSDAMLFADTPTMDGLRQVGAWTIDGRTHAGNTDSSAGWTTLYTGVEPDRHGVVDNGTMDARDWSYPTFAAVARESLGLRTAMAAHWVPAAVNLHEEDAFDDVTLGDDAHVADRAAAWLVEAVHDVVVTHLDDVDHTGHGHGFSPIVPEYVDAIEQADRYLLTMIDGLLHRASLASESWLIVVVTDHGGEGTSHGPRNLPNQMIPFVFAGSEVPRGELGGALVTHMDVAPTVLAHLGWEGETVHGFDGVTRAGVDDIVTPGAESFDVETVCDDRIDNDGDSWLDCADADCDVAPACAPVCAEGSLGTSVGEAVAEGSNEGEDTDYSVTCARLPGAADVSFTWQAPTTDRYVVDTVGSSYDTIIAVYAGACAGPGDQLACNDDSDGLQSAVQLDTEADAIYSIVVSGFDGATGDWVLNIARAESSERSSERKAHGDGCDHRGE